MASRYSGDLKISVVYDDRGDYRTAVSKDGRVLWRGRISPPRVGYGQGVGYDSPKAYDSVAEAALAFADNERSGISDAAEFDDSGYKIRRVPRYHQQYPGGSSRRPRFKRRDPVRRR